MTEFGKGVCTSWTPWELNLPAPPCVPATLAGLSLGVYVSDRFPTVLQPTSVGYACWSEDQLPSPWNSLWFTPHFWEPTVHLLHVCT